MLLLYEKIRSRPGFIRARPLVHTDCTVSPYSVMSFFFIVRHSTYSCTLVSFVYLYCTYCTYVCTVHCTVLSRMVANLQYHQSITLTSRSCDELSRTCSGLVSAWDALFQVVLYLSFICTDTVRGFTVLPWYCHVLYCKQPEGTVREN